MDLYQAFDLHEGAIVAAVGGGGKTSLVYGLAEEAALRGLSAVITTTTKFTLPAGYSGLPVIETHDCEAVQRLEAVIRRREAVVACNGRGPRGRLLGFLPATIDAVAALSPGLIAIESDGSAHRAFKAPADHEPVIPASATDVVVCVGLEVLGRTFDDRWVHRSEIAARLASVSLGSPVTPDSIVRVLLHPLGGRKQVPPAARIHALLNHPITPDHERLAIHIAERLVYGGYRRAVVATAHQRDGVLAVVS